MIRNMPICMRIMAAGCAVSSLLALLCMCYIFYLPQSADAIALSGKIDFCALLSQRVLTLTVFCAIASDVLVRKKPKED